MGLSGAKHASRSLLRLCARATNSRQKEAARRAFTVAASQCQQNNNAHEARKPFRFALINKRERQLQLAEDYCGPLSPFAREIQLKLRSSYVDPFLMLDECIERGEADSDVVRVCLLAAKDLIFKLPRTARVAEAKPKQFALKVMTHILKDPKLWLPIALADFQAGTSLCWFAIAEGMSDKMITWIQVATDVSSHVPARAADQPGLWRGSLLCCLVEAHNLHDVDNDAGPAIQCLLKVMVNKMKLAEQMQGRRRSKDTLLDLSAWPATAKLVSALTSGRVMNTDPALYDAVVEIRRRYSTKSTDVEQRLALAHLASHHPAKPSAIPAIEFIHELVTNKGGVVQEDVALTESIARLMIRAHTLLTSGKNEKAAIWMDKAYQEAFSSPMPTPAALSPAKALPGTKSRNGRVQTTHDAK